MRRRFAQSIVLAFVGCFVWGVGSAAGTGVIGADSLDMIVILDRSGSMVGANWDGSVSGLSEYFHHPFSSGASVGLNFFGVEGAGNQCDPTLYDPLQNGLGEIPGHAVILENALAGQSPGGATPTHPALNGSLLAATSRILAYPDHEVIVVLVTDGDPSECETNITQIAGLASSAFNAFGVRTFVVGLPGANGDQLNQIASGGGTRRTFMLDDPSSLGSTLIRIMLEAVGLAIFDDGFETGDTVRWSDWVP